MEQCHNHHGILEFQAELLKHLERIDMSLTAIEDELAQMRNYGDDRFVSHWAVIEELKLAVGQLGFRKAWHLAHPPQDVIAEGVDESNLLA